MKKGVSLIMLAVIIVLMSILAGVTIFSGEDVIKNSKLSNFTTNMSKIQDAVVSYQAIRGTLPITSGSAVLQKTDLVNLVEEENQDEISNEITKNGDDTSEFYYLDINKLGVQDTVYEITSSSNSLVVNSKGTHVYFVDGYKVNQNVYFSITEDII